MTKIENLKSVVLFNNKYNNQTIKNHSISNNVQTNKKVENELSQLAILGKTQVSFRAKGLPLNKKDLLFINTIAGGLGISALNVDKMKEALSNFLEKNNLKSMDDIKADEQEEKQIDIVKKFVDVLHLDKNKDKYKADFLMFRTNERCEMGDGYFPSEVSFEEFKDQVKNFEKIIIEKKMKVAKNENKIDQQFINSVVRTLQLNPKDAIKLVGIIFDTLEDNNIFLLKDLFQFSEDGMPDQDFLAIYDSMLEKIKTSLNLSDDDVELFDDEMHNRLMHMSDANSYIPITHPIDKNNEDRLRDNKIIYDVLNKHKLGHHATNLFVYALKDDAYNNGLNNVFELFTNEEQYDTPKISSLLEHPIFKNKKEDILIDLYNVSKNVGEAENNIDELNHKKEVHTFKVYAFMNLLTQNLNLSKQEAKEIIKYLKKQSFDSNKDMWKIAYELGENHNLGKNTSESIVEMIKNVNSMEESQLFKSHIDYLRTLTK